MTLSDIAKRKSEFATRKVGEELVLVPIKQGVAEMNVMFTMNEVGSFIWNRLADGITAALIQEELTNEFEVSSEQARADVEAFISQLEEMFNE